MIEIDADLWSYPAWARVVTTNGQVRKDGRAVMGAGVAKAAAQRYPDIERLLGAALREHGNHVHAFFCPTGRIIAQYDHVITFPTKEHWRDPSTLSLIERSAREMAELFSNPRYESWGTVVMPRPGTGRGGLRWDEVRPVIAPILDDRFVVCS